MNKITNVEYKKHKKVTPQNPRQKFNAYCKKIKQQQERIEKLKQLRSDTLERFERDILPEEQSYVRIVYNNTLQLCNLVTRKSFAAYQKDILYGWIENNMENLLCHPFTSHVDIAELNEKVLSVMPQGEDEYDDEIMPEEVERFREILEESPVYKDFSDEEIVEMMRDPRVFEEKLLEKMCQTEESDIDDNSEPFHEFQDEPAVKELFDKSVLKQMYKRLASLLHPDKEMDEQKRKEKHQLMLRLSQARKEHNIWTLLEMYQEYVDADALFSEKELPALNQLLENRLEKLKEDYAQLNHDYELMEGLVWSKLHAQTPKGVEKNIIEHIDYLDGMIIQEKKFSLNISTVSAAKSFLKMYQLEMNQQRKKFFFEFFDVE